MSYLRSGKCVNPDCVIRYRWHSGNCKLKPAESVSPAPQPTPREFRLQWSHKPTPIPLAQETSELWYSETCAEQMMEAYAEKLHVSLREELDKAHRDLGAYRQAVQRGEEDYIDADGLLRCFIDEQERLNGVVADMRKALETIANKACMCLSSRDENWHGEGCWRAIAIKALEVKP